MKQKLIVGVMPNQVITKYRGFLYIGDESVKDTPENRLYVKALGGTFYRVSTIRSQIVQPMRRQARLNLDCQSCGACCAKRTGKDGLLINGIMPDEQPALEAGMPGCVIPDKMYPKDLVLRKYPIPFQSIEACPFFSGKPGKSCSCSIYSDRPSVCRTFQPASDTCLTIRQMFFHDQPNDPRTEQEKLEFDKLTAR